MIDLAYIPSPSRGEWFLGPIPIRGYAFAIILGVIAAIWIAERRWVARGGRPGTAGDIALWAVPFGLIGGRLYHADGLAAVLRRRPRSVARPADLAGRSACGARSRSERSAPGSAAAARASGCPRSPTPRLPGIAVAQAIGRFGNWFNQELYGRPTDLPWVYASTRTTGCPGTRTSRPTTQRSSTRRCGASASQP